MRGAVVQIAAYFFIPVDSVFNAIGAEFFYPPIIGDRSRPATGHYDFAILVDGH